MLAPDDKNAPPRSALLRQLALIGLLTMVGMTIFETVKQFVHPEISVWQSHGVTILFSTIVALIVGTIVLPRIHAAHRAAVAELKRAEAERASRLASLGTLATGLAHEIKNPLAAMLTSAHAALQLKDKPDSGERLAKSLENVVESARRCDEIVTMLRKFARDPSPEKQRRDVNEVVRRAVESSRAFCESHHAGIRMVLGEDLSPARINTIEIELLLINLIHNAGQAGAGGVKIAIYTEQVDDVVRLTVQDDGPGISDHAKQHAFEPFYSTRHEEGGMGLGLSIVHGIVADHNGSIRIDGGVGQGTTVAVELPIARGEDS